MDTSIRRSKWAAIGAAVAVTLGAGGIGITEALTESGERPIYLPIEPCRLADLRPEPALVGDRPAPLAADETYTLDGWGTVGDCTLPSGTAGLALNVTAVDATAPTFLTIFPADAAARPGTSNLNPAPGQPPTPNAVNVDLAAADGKFSIYNKAGNVNVIVDVVGIYDDHHHDDRYYTEAEVDALNTPMMYRHVSTDDNTVSNRTVLDHPLLNNNPNALVIAEHSFTSNYIVEPMGVWYNGSRWTIFRQSGLVTDFPIGNRFNVLFVADPS